MDHTIQYDKFKISPKNRPIDPLNLSKIKSSMQKQNLTMISPIIVNKDWVVIDGQHRLEACKQLGLPVYYIQSNVSDSAMVLLNAAQKKWGRADYAKFYSQSGNSIYQSILDMCAKLNISINLLLYTLGYSGSSIHDFDDGEISFNPERLSTLETVWPMITDLIQAISTVRPELEKCVKACRWTRAFYICVTTPGYDHEHMMHQINAANHVFCPIHQIDAILSMFTRCYNYKNRRNKAFKQPEKK